MNTELLFVHGRSQQHKDSAALKQSWLDALARGLSAQGLTLPVDDAAVHFPYYGDTLHQLVDGVPDRQLAAVVVRGTEGNEDEQDFLASVLDEVRTSKGISDTQVRETGAEAGLGSAELIDKGVRPTAWMHAVLASLDQFLPGISGPTLALVTRDVYQYLRNPGIRDVIDSGVRQALRPGVRTVVVAHSLGTIVAYNILRKEAARNDWQVPLLVTVGSPLAISVIKRALAPISRPPVGNWFNAADPRDIVALWPIAAPHFVVEPAVENKLDVVNHTDNRHGIGGYLDDPLVSQRIHDALLG